MLIFFLSFIFQWVLVVIAFTTFILLILWMLSGLGGKVPYVSVPQKVLPDLYRVLKLKDDSVLYDLGSGDGKVLFYLSKKVNNARYIGIENRIFPFIIARFTKWLNNKTFKNVKIIKKNFFDMDLSDATHIFVYLYPNMLDDLLVKLEKELRPGTILVSVSFQFTLKRPTKEIDLERNKYGLVRKIYIYEF